MAPRVNGPRGAESGPWMSDFWSQADPFAKLVCWCATSPYVPGAPHSFFAFTGVNGIATFNIAGGGCVERGLAAIPGPNSIAAEVFPDFVKVGECGVVSPDAVTRGTDGQAERPGGNA